MGPTGFLARGVALAAVLAAVGLTTGGRVLAQQEPFYAAAYVSELPTDPRSPVWGRAAASEVPLIPQAGILPALTQASVPKVTVRALYDGERLVILMSWQDRTRDALSGRPDLFRDGAAIMFPVTEGLPNVCMGAAGQVTNLWHWKADWQEDIDKGFQDVVDHYPNFYKDVYPFVTGSPPYRMPQDFSAPEAQAYLAGLSAGNPLSQPLKSSPVEELVSQGFGTATHKAAQNVSGQGVWTDGTWRVMFSRSLKAADQEAADLQGRKQVAVAFAVWDGSNQEVGARKQLSSFLTLAVGEETNQMPVWLWGVFAAIAAATVWLGWPALVRRSPRE